VGLFVLLAIPSLFSQIAVAPTVTQNLNLGSFYLVGTGGTITFTPTSNTTGTRTPSAGVSLYGNSSFLPLVLTWRAPAGGGSKTIYGISQSTNTTLPIVQLESSSITLTRTGGGGSMTFVFGTPIINGTTRSFGTGISVGNNSNNTFVYGGVLTVGSIINNPEGNYSANFSVSLIYQ
jgi:hypothetical protein